MRWVAGYGLYLVSEPHTRVRPPASPCMSSSTRYNPYPTPAYLITNSEQFLYASVSFDCIHPIEKVRIKEKILAQYVEVTLKIHVYLATLTACQVYIAIPI